LALAGGRVEFGGEVLGVAGGEHGGEAGERVACGLDGRVFGVRRLGLFSEVKVVGGPAAGEGGVGEFLAQAGVGEQEGGVGGEALGDVAGERVAVLERRTCAAADPGPGTSDAETSPPPGRLPVPRSSRRAVESGSDNASALTPPCFPAMRCDNESTLGVLRFSCLSRTIMREAREGTLCPQRNPTDRAKSSSRSSSPSWPARTVAPPWSRFAANSTLSRVSKVAEVLEGLELQAEGVRHLVLDLRGLTFMDSSGLHELIRQNEFARSNRHNLAVVRGTNAIELLLELTGVKDHLVLVDDPDDLVPPPVAH
jgi:anti-anti-sigma factor